MELGRGTLKQLLLILILLGNICFLTSQEQVSSEETAFPAVNEEELPLFTQEEPAAEDAEVPASVGLSDLIRVTVILAAVIAVIYFFLYFLKKISPMAESSEDRIHLLSTRHLKRDSSLHLIEVGNQVFLIGSGSSNVNLISEITDQETLDQIHLDAEETPAVAGGNFRNLIRKGLSLGTGKKISDQSPDFLRSQRDRLRNLGDGE